MNDRERFLACVLGEPVDRVPFYLWWSPWSTTWARWEREGKPDEVTDARSWWDPDPPPRMLPLNCGPCPRIERTVLDEDDETVTFIDGWGIKRRDFKHHQSMSEFIAFPVKTRDDWECFKHERLDPDDLRRLEDDWRDVARQCVEDGVGTKIGYFPDVGIYGTLRWLLGDEECLVAFYTMPDLVHDVMNHMTDVYLTVFEKVACEVRIDVVHLWEDFCGKQGPLISPAHWDEFIGPCYRRIKTFADDHDIPVFSVDTDGNPDLVIPVMMDAGMNYLFPFEVAAGCDVNVMGEKYPTLAMSGGIDKRALARGPEAIDAELDRIMPAVRRGRYIPDLDHLVPDDVSWSNYCYFAEGLKKRLGKC